LKNFLNRETLFLLIIFLVTCTYYFVFNKQFISYYILFAAFIYLLFKYKFSSALFISLFIFIFSLFVKFINFNPKDIDIYLGHLNNDESKRYQVILKESLGKENSELVLKTTNSSDKNDLLSKDNQIYIDGDLKNLNLEFNKKNYLEFIIFDKSYYLISYLKNIQINFQPHDKTVEFINDLYLNTELSLIKAKMIYGDWEDDSHRAYASFLLANLYFKDLISADSFNQALFDCIHNLYQSAYNRLNNDGNYNSDLSFAININYLLLFWYAYDQTLNRNYFHSARRSYGNLASFDHKNLSKYLVKLYKLNELNFNHSQE